MKHFHEILATLGASKVEEVSSTENWTFWSAEYRTPVSTVRGHYLYLNYKCPLLEANPNNLGKWRSTAKDGYEVIVAPRSPLVKNLDQTRAAFQGKSIRTCRQLLLDNFLRDFTSRPIDVEEHFVDPDLALEDGKNVHEATTFLRAWMTGTAESPKNASCGVLTANGGIGKTTVARMLCDKIRKSDSTAIPILIESDQWKDLVKTTITMDLLLDLAITRRFEQASRLLSNEMALRVLAQEGLFIVIFDGFDELCGSPSCTYKPQEIITELTEMLSPEDEDAQAKVLLTTRETYWNSISAEMDVTKLNLFRLRGFDNNQRKHYFQVRLSKPGERDVAFRLSRQIGGAIYEDVSSEDKNEERPSGVPFVLDLVARFVHNNPDADVNPYKADPLEGFLIDICRRENARQSLNIEAERQLALFEELFRAYPSGATLDDLRDYLGVVCNVVDPKVIHRFTSHVLLAPLGKDRFSPRYEVLSVYFVARFLAKNLSALDAKTERRKIAQILAENSTGNTQVLDWLVRQLKRLEGAKLKAAMNHAVEIIAEELDKETQRASSMALFHLAAALVSGNDKAERTTRLFDLLKISGKVVKGQWFSGLVRGFDFSGCRFQGGGFLDVEFRNCKFAPATRFTACTFDGTLSFEACEAANEIDVDDDCSKSKEAEFALASVRDQGVRFEILREFAEDALTRALKKFKVGYGFRSIRYKHRSAGFSSSNPLSKKIWGVLSDERIIERHEISNVDEGGLNIVDDKDLRREIIAYLDNAVLSARLKKVIEELTKSR
jgi:hypothetical protein